MKLFFLFILPAFTAFVTMIVTMIMQRFLEKELNNKQPMFLFHVVNITFVLMMHGTAAVVFYGLMLRGIAAHGWWVVTQYAYIHPLPFIIGCYIIAVPIFRSYVRPYRMKKGSNVLYLKTRQSK
ncbi:hypothetical protein SAMN05192534_105111 [Alteribacillus persepolensis]|uniref:Uncharacterized protein n=1 Tax=Alteribacillus persepolensis TaxID=568899 RepID=A0A1G8C9T0_9BACI|nr:hypothetical protein [Alteribacillus persepolensis]SDH42236.1 hypothetical protein SAMN05192534_105111 [Alteribacillus persepolensis]